MQLKNQAWKVFPCIRWADDSPEKPPEKRGKSPLTPNGFKDASNDPVVIAAWRKAFRGCNWAIPAGDNGITVADPDSAEAEAALFDLQLVHGQLPETYTVITPRGRHLYFAGVCKGSTSKLAPELDIKSLGGYVMAPGSFVNGHTYVAENPDVPIAPLPAWIAELSGQRTVARKLPASPLAGTPFTPAQLTEMISNLDPDCPRDEWRDIAAALHASPCTDGNFDKRDLFVRWSRGEVRHER